MGSLSADSRHPTLLGDVHGIASPFLGGQSAPHLPEPADPCQSHKVALRRWTQADVSFSPWPDSSRPARAKMRNRAVAGQPASHVSPDPEGSARGRGTEGLNPGIRRPRATLVSSKAPNFANYSEPRLASPSGAYEPVVLEVVSHTTLACDRSLSHRCHHHGATPSGDLCRPRNGQNLEPATKNAPMIKAHVFDIGGF